MSNSLVRTTGNNADEENILYELLIHVEWQLEPEVLGIDPGSQGGSIFYRALTKTPRNLWSVASYLGRAVWPSLPFSPSLARILNSGSEWQLAVGAQGAVIAILQNYSLEIRAKKDEYTSIVGKNGNLYPDPFPSWRKVSWSDECSMVAVAYSNGTTEIFNTVGASLFTIYSPGYHEGNIQVDASNALAALIFSDIRTQKKKWAAELIMVDYFGHIRGYLVSPTEGYQESYTFSCHKLYPYGISAATIIGSLLILSGSCKYLNDKSLRNNGLGHGLSIWRMVNDYPYYKQVPTVDEEDYLLPSIGLLSSFYESPPNYDPIYRLCVSPLGRHLVSLHGSGSIAVWDVPSLRKRKFWSLDGQPDVSCKIDATDSFGISKDPLRRYSAGTVNFLANHIVDVKWWSEDAIIICRFSGAVTICSVNSLTNLLGKSPEYFEGVPQISEAYDSCFLGLEMETKVTKSSSRYSHFYSNDSTLVTEEHTDQPDEYSDSDNEDIPPWKKSKKYIKNALYWVTDAERFRPTSKRQRVISRTCRLLRFKRTTPQELFGRKIKNEEYGEALVLAKSYSLDCDAVYHEQWLRTPMSIASIQDYLSRLKSRSLVLSECLNRVPNDIDTVRELLLYGLKGTELDTLVATGNEPSDDLFLVSDLALDYEEDIDISNEENEELAKEWAKTEEVKRRQLLAKIDLFNLSQEQRDVIRIRQRLLKYFDRLVTYEIVLGGGELAMEKFDAEFYRKFRDQEETEAAILFARDGNVNGVDAMLTYHGVKTRMNRLDIISNFPPTMAPYEYRALLPECDFNGEVFEWEEEIVRETDWCEDAICRSSSSLSNEDTFLSPSEVGDWYRRRARQIESCSHFVDVALDLIKLGKERNIPDLENLQRSLDTLDIIVYEVGMGSLNLDQFEDMSNMEKLNTLMSTSTIETHIQNLRRWALPFLSTWMKPSEGDDLLREYIRGTSKKDLSIVLKVIQNSCEDSPILRTPDECCSVALECIYECENPSQLPRAFAIMDSLPLKEDFVTSKTAGFLDEIDLLEDILTACEVLSSHNLPISPSVLKQARDNREDSIKLITKLTRKAARRDNKLSDSDWTKLSNDILEIQQKVFVTVNPQTCFEILTEALLTSGVEDYILYCKELMDTKADKSPIHNPYLRQIPFQRAVPLVVGAAKEYFNSAETFLDADMDLARLCLKLIDSEHEDINSELDLISSLQILPELGINRLPLQVRLVEERLCLIEECLSKNCRNYRLGSRILHLANLLRACGSDADLRKGKVLCLLAEAAFKSADYDAASSFCTELTNGGHGAGWRICASLGKCNAFSQSASKAAFLDFALTHAESAHLEDLLTARNEIELALLYSKIRTRVERDSSTPESDDGFEDAKEEFHEVESFDEWCEPLQSGVLLSLPPNVLSAASRTTFVASKASKKLWNNAIGWLKPRRSGKMDNVYSDDSGNDGFEKQGMHAFDAGLNQDLHISRIGSSYKSYAPPSIPNPSLDLSMTLLRIALIEETLQMGNSTSTNDTVLCEVIRGVLHEDLALGLSFLMMIKSPKEAWDILKLFPKTEISLQVSQYFFALQIYTSTFPWKNSSIAPIFLHPPSDVINYIPSIEKQNDLSEDVKLYIKYFHEVQKLFDDYVQGQALKNLGTGVAIDRFLTDDAYKMDTVIGLAMTTDEKVLDLAISLAKKYKVNLLDIYVKHFQYLFDSDLTNDLLKEIIEKSGIIDKLKAENADFEEIMPEIFSSIDGKDHARLITYYKIYNKMGLELCPESVYNKNKAQDMDLELAVVDPKEVEIDSEVPDYSYTVPDMDTEVPDECGWDLDMDIEFSDDGTLDQDMDIEVTDAKTTNQELDIETTDNMNHGQRNPMHIEVLEEFVSAGLDSLDYKYLLEADENVLDVLKPVLTVDNVDLLAKLSQRIHVASLEKFFIDPSRIYCTWCQKLFFDPSYKPKKMSEWLKRFESLRPYLIKMGSWDVMRLIRCLTVSSEAIENLSIDLRIQLFQKMSKFCKATFKENEFAGRFEDLKTGICFASLDELGMHLRILKSENFRALSSSKDLMMKEYAQKFESSGASSSELWELAHSILNNCSGLEKLRTIMSLFPDDFGIAEDVFNDVLNNVLENWDSSDSDHKSLTIMEHLLDELDKYVEDDGELLEKNFILETLLDFTKDESKSTAAKAEVFELINKRFSLVPDDSNRFQVMQTTEILQSAWVDTSLVNDETNQEPEENSIETIKDDSPVWDSQVDNDADEPKSQESNEGSLQGYSVKANQVESEEGREELLNKLLEKMNSAKHGESALKLLKIWPNFKKEKYASPYTNPWLRVCLRILDTSGSTDMCALILSTCVEARRINEFFHVEEIVEKLLSTYFPTALRAAAKLTFFTQNRNCHNLVIVEYEKIDKVEKWHYDSELIELIIERKYVVDFIRTSFYGTMVSFLTSSDEHSHLIPQFINQLDERYPLEAASVAALSGSLHRSLRSASNMINTFKFW